VRITLYGSYPGNLPKANYPGSTLRMENVNYSALESGNLPKANYPGSTLRMENVNYSVLEYGSRIN